MHDRDRLLDIIEQAAKNSPACPACDAPTVIRAHDGLSWLECSAAPARDGPLGQILAIFRPHLRRPLYAVPESRTA